MNDEIQFRLKPVLRKLEEMCQSSEDVTEKKDELAPTTARLRLLTELVREQVEDSEIRKKAN